MLRPSTETLSARGASGRGAVHKLKEQSVRKESGPDLARTEAGSSG